MAVSDSNLLRSHLANSSWLLLEHVVRGVAGILVGVQVAQHLGPERFGSLSYALAIVGLATPFVRLGLDAIIIRETVRQPDNSSKLIGTAFRLKIVAAFVVLALIVAASPFLTTDAIERLCLVIVGIGLLFQATDVVDLYFQGKHLARLASFCRTGALLATAALKLELVRRDAGLMGFALASMAEQLLVAIAYVVLQYQRGDRILPGALDHRVLRFLLTEGHALFLSGIVVVAYTRLDQLLLRNILGAEELGLYVAATNLSEALYFLPLVFASMAYPVIISLQEREPSRQARYRNWIYRWLILGSIIVSTLVSLFANQAISLLYGKSFFPSGPILSVHIWTLVFVAYSSLFTRLLISEGKQPLILRITLLGLGANIGSLWLFTAYWGLIGAAWASLVAHLVVTTGLLILYPPARRDLLTVFLPHPIREHP